MRFRTLALWSVVAGLLAIAGCGDGTTPGDADAGGDGGGTVDGGGTGDGGGVSMRCGNSMIEGTEECDDGNRDPDDGCSADCALECGDGTVSGDELCDTAIAAGSAGACPTACDDGDACTTDALDGADCSAECSHGPITAAANGDGCCPSGATASTDDDCPGSCGDGLVTGAEACDTAIASGSVGACPTSCDDGMNCTSDVLQMAGTCDAVCTNTPITAPADGDTCCPSGATLATDSDCAAACGDGVLSAGENCDTGIAAGSAGACPTACDDGMACTTDMLAGAGTCDAQCTSTAITTPANGDGCCPAGATIATDNDCTATCGDGVVTGGEACDTAITTGAGSCPTACSDGMACTTDTLTGAGTCAATCSFPAITAPANGDGCCPPGATRGTDSDCPIVCGDGVVSAGETCDTGIASGTGSCPTACSDGMVCTSDVLANMGTCTAVCTFPAITTPTNGDGCCPPGANIGNDNDCTARCGDGVISSPETCDDGNTTAGDGCSATCTVEAAMPTAYRFTDLDIRDPHVFASVFGCNDITNTVFGMDGLNPLLQDSIQLDGDMPADGLLDLSIVHVFTPLLQTAGTMTPSYLAFPDCTAPMSSTACTLPAGASRLMGDATNMGGTSVCLGALAGTTRGSYTPATVFPTAAGGGTCYVASAGTVTFDLGGIPITLTDAYIGGEWFGSPATEVRDGLIRGFISETVANHTYIPDGLTGFGSIDCQPLASLLPGGNPPALTAADPGPPAPCPRPTNPPANCSGNDDRDTGPGGESGWYFYLNFRAVRIASYTTL